MSRRPPELAITILPYRVRSIEVLVRTRSLRGHFRPVARARQPPFQSAGDPDRPLARAVQRWFPPHDARCPPTRAHTSPQMAHQTIATGSSRPSAKLLGAATLRGRLHQQHLPLRQPPAVRRTTTRSAFQERCTGLWSTSSVAAVRSHSAAAESGARPAPSGAL